MNHPAVIDDPRLKLIYERAAARYVRSLPLEHFMESTQQATQRKVTTAAFDLIAAARPEVQCFSELCIQYPRPDGEEGADPARVVPDNMVAVHPDRLPEMASFNLPLLKVRPLVVFEYVSKSSERKDFETNIVRYEQHIRVPYYLLYYPDADELTLFRLADGRFTSAPPNHAGRLAIPELELEVGILDRYARYWFRGKLLPLTAELQRERDAERAGRLAAERQAEAERQRAEAAEQQTAAMAAELARLRDELARAKGPPA